VPKTIFISHESVAKREAVRFKELLVNSSSGIECFLTSDWYSLESGAPWFTPLVERLRAADALLAIITRSEAFRSLWMSFEIGAGFGSGKLPKIFVFGGVSWEHIPHPLAGLQLIDTGDTNRWVRDLQSLGVERVTDHQNEFATLFRQTPTA
jgi:hypothetical protein